jgi:hypothetical protein
MTIDITKITPEKLAEMNDALLVDNQHLRGQLETERIRLAACGVVALANTPESAAKAREMLPEYRSASCDDVARLVDSEMALRKQVAIARDNLQKLSCLGNGDQPGNSIGNTIAQDALYDMDRA